MPALLLALLLLSAAASADASSCSELRARHGLPSSECILLRNRLGYVSRALITIRKNTVMTTTGGGSPAFAGRIHVTSNAIAVISGVHISGGSSGASAIRVESAELRVEDCTIDGRTAPFVRPQRHQLTPGPARCLQWPGNPRLAQGGAIYGNDARVHLHNTTIEGNEAASRAFFKDGSRSCSSSPCFIENPVLIDLVHRRAPAVVFSCAARAS